jgi:hypothetical protein
VWGIYKGTAAAPITAAGQQLKIVVHEAVTKDKCFDNPSDGACISPLVVEAYGTAATTMVTQAALFYAKGSSPTVGGTDIQAMSAVGDAYDGAVGYGMGAYLQGRTFTGTGRALGAEISAGNYSGSNTCAVATTGIGRCDGAWFAARSNNAATPLDSAVHIGTDAAVGGFGSWKHGITINNNAIFNAPNTNTRTFADYSSSEVSLYIRGTHPYALITDPNGGGIVGLGTFTPTARLHIAGNLSRSTWAATGVAFKSDAATYTDTTSTGAVGYGNAVNAFMTPTLAATNATTYTSTATVFIQGCPIAGTNVTSPSCNALSVGSGGSYFGGRVEHAASVVAPSLDTVGTIAGSLCRTSTGTFIYKAGANCF